MKPRTVSSQIHVTVSLPEDDHERIKAQVDRIERGVRRLEELTSRFVECFANGDRLITIRTLGPLLGREKISPETATRLVDKGWIPKPQPGPRNEHIWRASEVLECVQKKQQELRSKQGALWVSRTA